MMDIYIYNNTNYDVRARSSAGGLFSALAESTISRGGAVYGAAFDSDWRICHAHVDSIANLDSLRRSKYAFTDITTCFGQLADDLASGRPLLVVGTPCQIAIIRKKFGERANMLMVEVVCHGAPQPKYWDMYLDELLKSQGKNRADIASINFRDKTEGWKNYSVRVDFKDGSQFIQNHRDNLYILAFVYDYTLRQGCSKCPYKYPNSKADISMGDFWGIEVLAPEANNDLGTTIAIANTDKGTTVLSSLADATNLTVEEVAKYNPALIKAPNVPSDKPEFETAVANEGFHSAASRFLKSVFDRRAKSTSLRSSAKHIIRCAYTYLIPKWLKRKI